MGVRSERASANRCRRGAESGKVDGSCLLQKDAYMKAQSPGSAPFPVREPESTAFAAFLPEELDGTENSGNHHCGCEGMGTADREVMSIVLLRQHVHDPAGRDVVNQDLIVNPLGQGR